MYQSIKNNRRLISASVFCCFLITKSQKGTPERTSKLRTPIFIQKRGHFSFQGHFRLHVLLTLNQTYLPFVQYPPSQVVLCTCFGIQRCFPVVQPFWSRKALKSMVLMQQQLQYLYLNKTKCHVKCSCHDANATRSSFTKLLGEWCSYASCDSKSSCILIHSVMFESLISNELSDLPSAFMFLALLTRPSVLFCLRCSFVEAN